MNIIGISNLFNLTAQQLGFLGYHYGFESDMNRNVTNNLNVGNSIGSQFPYVLFEKPVCNTTFSNKPLTMMEVRLNFYDLEYYNNDGTLDVSQTIEKENELRTLAIAFINSLVVQGSSSALTIGGRQISISNQSVRFDTQEMATVNRCIQIVASFSMSFFEDCPTFVFDQNLVIAPYSYPPSETDDYEKLQP